MQALEITLIRKLRARSRFGVVATGASKPFRQSIRLRPLLLGGTALALAALATPWRPGVVVGSSMAPTLRPGTPFVYETLPTGYTQFQPGDVVIIRRQGETWIKRVYAPGGTHFWAWREVQDGSARLEPIRPGQLRRFQYFATALRQRMGRECDVVQVRVPPGTVFIVSDDESGMDSCELGVIPAHQVIGKVTTAFRRSPVQLTHIPDWVELSVPNRGTTSKPSRQTYRPKPGSRIASRA